MNLSLLLQSSNRQVWVQAAGRSLYQAGYGLIQFYIPLVFVNQLGLSATVVGIGVGTGSLAGVAGHLLGGYLADSPQYGRRQTLLFAAGLSILAALVLTLTQNLPLLVLANLLLGLSAGCYWTAADASVMDVTPPEQRHHAFAILVLSDSLGGGLGILGGGLLLAQIERSQTLFVMASLVFLIFLVLIQLAGVETRQPVSDHASGSQGFAAVLKDRALGLFVLSNVLFTTYVALVNTTLPLYFTSRSFVSVADAPAPGMALVSIANLFTWCYIGAGAVLQLPIAQLLGSISKVRILMFSMLLWGGGFLLTWGAGLATSFQMVWIIAALCVLSIATAVYKPFAPTIVAELAPKSLRGVYIAVSYQCWSIGYFIGPILGGWAMDQSPSTARNTWAIAALTTIGGLIVLHFLDRVRHLSDATSKKSKDNLMAQ